MFATPVRDHHSLNVAIGGLKCLIGGQGYGCPGVDFSIKLRLYPYLVKPVGFGMKLIKRGFIGYPQQNQNAAGNANGKARYINKGVKTIFEEVANGYQKIISKHG